MSNFDRIPRLCRQALLYNQVLRESRFAVGIAVVMGAALAVTGPLTHMRREWLLGVGWAVVSLGLLLVIMVPILWRFNLAWFRERIGMCALPAGGILVLSGAALLVAPRFPQTAELLRLPVALALMGVPTLLLALWLLFPAWFSVRFRILAYWIARNFGLARRWLSTSWRQLFVPFAVAAVLLWSGWLIYDEWTRPAGTPAKSASTLLTSTTALQVLAAGLLIASADRILRVRRQIVIESFVNHTGIKELDPQVQGLAERLLHEITRLTDLFRVIDEASPDGDKAGPLDATIGVGVTGEALLEAIEANKIALGPVQVSLDKLLGLFGRLIPRPRLAGGIHRESDRFVLISTLSGCGLMGHWRTTGEILAGGRGDRDGVLGTSDLALDGLIGELALRLVTEQIKIGSPRWQAVRYFTEGLRIYRETLLTPRDRDPNLIASERAFVRALGEDAKFAQTHYNLAIIYRDLGRTEAALTAFRRAVQENIPQTVQRRASLTRTYYALATMCYKADDHAEVVRLCNQALRLKPTDPLSWNLRGLSLGRLGSSEQTRASRKSREIAVALAWRELCHSALSGKDNQSRIGEVTHNTLRDKVIEVARTTLRDLAIAHREAGEPHRAARLIRQAARLEPAGAEVLVEQGRIYLKLDRADAARASLEQALAIDPRETTWALLARACAEQMRKTRSLDRQLRLGREAAATCLRATEYAPAAFRSPAGSAAWDDVRQAWETLIDGLQRRSVAQQRAEGGIAAMETQVPPRPPDARGSHPLRARNIR